MLTYGEVVERLCNELWSIKAGTSLYAALDRVGEDNQRREEPLLPALVVVDERPRLPGDGFFNKFYPEVREGARRTSCHSECIDAVWAFDWPD